MKKLLIFNFVFMSYFLFSTEILYEDSQYVLYKPTAVVKEKISTNIHNREVRTRRIAKFSLNELNANTIQAAYYGPLKDKSEVYIIIPQYVSTLQIMFPSKTTLATIISGNEIRRLYKAVRNNSDDIHDIIYKTFMIGNRDYSNYILYGKDKFKRNVGYIYNLGKENQGIVFFYPDKFPNIFKKTYISWSSLGWNTFIENFMSIISKYNSHLIITSTFIKNEKVYIIKYR
jgi:hypothetical protein